MTRRRLTLLVVLLAAVAAWSGCAHASPSTLPLPVVRVGDAADGHTVVLHRGQRLRVVLGSTYWQFHRSSNPDVLRLGGTPVVKPRLAGCVPGQGCGTATATFVAAGAGRATVVATRTSCGEAMGCTADSGRYSVAVVVKP